MYDTPLIIMLGGFAMFGSEQKPANRLNMMRESFKWRETKRQQASETFQILAQIFCCSSSSNDDDIIMSSCNRLSPPCPEPIVVSPTAASVSAIRLLTKSVSIESVAPRSVSIPGLMFEPITIMTSAKSITPPNLSPRGPVIPPAPEPLPLLVPAELSRESPLPPPRGPSPLLSQESIFRRHRALVPLTAWAKEHGPPAGYHSPVSASALQKFESFGLTRPAAGLQRFG